MLKHCTCFLASFLTFAPFTFVRSFAFTFVESVICSRCHATTKDLSWIGIELAQRLQVQPALLEVSVLLSVCPRLWHMSSSLITACLAPRSTPVCTMPKDDAASVP
jgi:hypothetical protein